MTDQLKLGSLIDANQKRDAIHIAVAPVVAFERLSPGQDIGFAIEGDTEKVRGSSKEPIGIVDPFLKGAVFPGDRFWMFLYPYTITSLRHDWIHPAFGTEMKSISPSEVWMREFAERADLTYRTVMSAAAEFVETGEKYIQSGSEQARTAGWDNQKEFWQNYEILTGTTVPENVKEDQPFCCTC